MKHIPNSCRKIVNWFVLFTYWNWRLNLSLWFVTHGVKLVESQHFLWLASTNYLLEVRKSFVLARVLFSKSVTSSIFKILLPSSATLHSILALLLSLGLSNNNVICYNYCNILDHSDLKSSNFIGPNAVSIFTRYCCPDNGIHWGACALRFKQGRNCSYSTHVPMQSQQTRHGID